MEIDFLNDPSLRNTRPTGAPRWAVLLSVLLLIGIVSGTAFSLRIAASMGRAIARTTNQQGGTLLTHLRSLANPDDRKLRGETEDRINILLLGIGGEGHTGPLLTDTILIASVKPSTHEAALFSLPRDLVVNIPGYEYRKINNTYSFGEEDGRGGPALMRTVVEDVLGDTIHYFIRADFAGFTRFIDDLGGITLTVATPFVDRQYPTDDFGYQTIAFESGEQRFNGEQTLQFTRSRHGTNGEGSDFARAKRQQLVLLALKEKIFSFSTLMNPTAVANGMETLGEHILTDFEPWEILRLARLALATKKESIEHAVFDTSETGLLKAVTGFDGAYLLEPRLGTGKYGEIQLRFQSIFHDDAKKTASVVLQNGTVIPGLAAVVANRVESAGFILQGTTNATTRNETKTTIYDRTNGAKPEHLARLKALLNASVSISLLELNRRPGNFDATDLEASLINAEQPDSSGADFVVVLGSDQREIR